MYLENLVFDCRDQLRLGGFWAEALGATEITNNDDGYEARLTVGDDLYLDLCFGPPTEPVRTDTPRLHLDLLGGELDSSLGEFCRRAIQGRYPFERAATQEVTLADFSRMFSQSSWKPSFSLAAAASRSNRRMCRWRA